MTLILKKGSLLIPSGPCNHLHIVCNDPVFYPRANANCSLLVNISTVNELSGEYDNTCLLNSGEHPFVKHLSYVAYERADIFGENTLLRGIADGTFQTHDPINDAVFLKFIDGFSVSGHITPKIKKFFDTFCK